MHPGDRDASVSTSAAAGPPHGKKTRISEVESILSFSNAFLRPRSLSYKDELKRTSGLRVLILSEYTFLATICLVPPPNIETQTASSIQPSRQNCKLFSRHTIRVQPYSCRIFFRYATIIFCTFSQVLDLASHAQVVTVPESDPVTSLTCSALTNSFLVSIGAQSNVGELRLWELASTTSGSPNTSARILKRYFGHTQARFVLHPCFGGPHEEFVCCGSEQSEVFVWLRQTGERLAVLLGHTGTVNCVVGCFGVSADEEEGDEGVASARDGVGTWALISGSDDSTIRFWAGRGGWTGAEKATLVEREEDQRDKRRKLTA